ncbi:MAG: ParA family protein [Gammaproteobacteria bacterium]|nr:ParA family protein [Gammaproteobacteria bacterium]
MFRVLQTAQDYTDVVIDGPAYGEALRNAGIATSDLVVVPIGSRRHPFGVPRSPHGSSKKLALFKPALQFD